MNLLETNDAAVWAKEFVRLHGGDEDLMLTWFANAMCAQQDADARNCTSYIKAAWVKQFEKEVAPQIRSRTIEQCLAAVEAYCEKYMDNHERANHLDGLRLTIKGGRSDES